MAYKISEECISCGACQSECPNGAISEDESEYVINLIKCNDCSKCVDICPVGAITPESSYKENKIPLPMTKYCQVKKCDVEILEIGNSYTCRESLPIDKRCKQYNCLYHNAMSIASKAGQILFQQQVLNKAAYMELALTQLGAKDYCDNSSEYIFIREEVHQQSSGKPIYETDDVRVLEHGIKVKDLRILWDDIKNIYIDDKISAPPNISSYSNQKMETINIRVENYKGKSIVISKICDLFVVRTPNQPNAIKEGLLKVYAFIVSNIQERQWNDLRLSIGAGKSVQFGPIDITSTNISWKRLIGSETVGNSLFGTFKIENGVLSIIQIAKYAKDDDPLPELKIMKIGEVNKIPNVHILLAYLSSIIKLKNISLGDHLSVFRRAD
jgi:ferredoxin